MLSRMLRSSLVDHSQHLFKIKLDQKKNDKLSLSLTCSESFIFSEKRCDNFLLCFHFNVSAFIDDCAETHFLRLELQHISHEILLRFVHVFMQLRSWVSLQSHTEFELLIIHESARSWPLSGLS